MTNQVESWWQELAGGEILGGCAQVHQRRKIGQLLATDEGLLFVVDGHQRTSIAWFDLRSLFVFSQKTRKGEELSIDIGGKPNLSLVVVNPTPYEKSKIEQIRGCLQAKKNSELNGIEGLVALGKALYLGGLPDSPHERFGELVLDRTAIRVGGKPVLSWSECAGIIVDGGQVAKSKMKATLAFGIIGAVTAKGTMNQTVLTARREDGALGFIQIDGRSEQEVKAKILPLMMEVGVPLVEEFVPSRPGENHTSNKVLELADGIRHLGKLRDEGLLTDEEFTQQKLKLLVEHE